MGRSCSPADGHELVAQTNGVVREMAELREELATLSIKVAEQDAAQAIAHDFLTGLCCGLRLRRAVLAAKSVDVRPQHVQVLFESPFLTTETFTRLVPPELCQRRKR